MFLGKLSQAQKMIKADTTRSTVRETIFAEHKDSEEDIVISQLR